MLSHVQIFATPWTVATKAPLSMESSRQEYWSGLPFPAPDLEVWRQPKKKKRNLIISSIFFYKAQNQIFMISRGTLENLKYCARCKKYPGNVILFFSI